MHSLPLCSGLSVLPIMDLGMRPGADGIESQRGAVPYLFALRMQAPPPACMPRKTMRTYFNYAYLGLLMWQAGTASRNAEATRRKLD